MPRPAALDVDDWSTLVADTERFLHDWGAAAQRFGWPTWALFGIHRRAPASWRGRELVALLRGRPLIDLTARTATIRTGAGRSLTYYLPAHDPLHPAERALLWELEG